MDDTMPRSIHPRRWRASDGDPMGKFAAAELGRRFSLDGTRQVSDNLRPGGNIMKKLFILTAIAALAACGDAPKPPTDPSAAAPDPAAAAKEATPATPSTAAPATPAAPTTPATPAPTSTATTPAKK
jgi:hypothetical protein